MDTGNRLLMGWRCRVGRATEDAMGRATEDAMGRTTEDATAWWPLSLKREAGRRKPVMAQL